MMYSAGMTTTTKAKNKGCGHLLGLTGFVMVSGWISGAFHALTISKGWEWFVADTFHVPAISFVVAWGLSILVHLLTYVYRPTETDSEKPAFIVAVTGTLTSILLSLSSLFALWVLVQFR